MNLIHAQTSPTSCWTQSATINSESRASPASSCTLLYVLFSHHYLLISLFSEVICFHVPLSLSPSLWRPHLCLFMGPFHTLPFLIPFFVHPLAACCVQVQPDINLPLMGLTQQTVHSGLEQPLHFKCLYRSPFTLKIRTKMACNWLDIYSFESPWKETMLRQSLKSQNFILISSVCAKMWLCVLLNIKWQFDTNMLFISDFTVIVTLCHLREARNVENLFNFQTTSSSFLANLVPW